MRRKGGGSCEPSSLLGREEVGLLCSPFVAPAVTGKGCVNCLPYRCIISVPEHMVQTSRGKKKRLVRVEKGTGVQQGGTRRQSRRGQGTRGGGGQNIGGKNNSLTQMSLTQEPDTTKGVPLRGGKRYFLLSIFQGILEI